MEWELETLRIVQGMRAGKTSRKSHPKTNKTPINTWQTHEAKPGHKLDARDQAQSQEDTLTFHRSRSIRQGRSDQSVH